MSSRASSRPAKGRGRISSATRSMQLGAQLTAFVGVLVTVTLAVFAVESLAAAHRVARGGRCRDPHRKARLEAKVDGIDNRLRKVEAGHILGMATR